MNTVEIRQKYLSLKHPVYLKENVAFFPLIFCYSKINFYK